MPCKHFTVARKSRSMEVRQNHSTVLRQKRRMVTRQLRSASNTMHPSGQSGEKFRRTPCSGFLLEPPERGFDVAKHDLEPQLPLRPGKDFFTKDDNKPRSMWKWAAMILTCIVVAFGTALMLFTFVGLEDMEARATTIPGETPKLVVPQPEIRYLEETFTTSALNLTGSTTTNSIT
ncbi:hypothetical protein MTO96_039857 [Rhipicephalus appendiculatus]